MVLQDLLAETLEARRRLKPLTGLLNKNHICYSWSSYTKVQVLYKGITLIEEDLDTGSHMLQTLNIEVLQDFVNPDTQQPSDTSWHPA